MDHDEGEVALERGVRLAHRLDEVARVVALDEMGNDLGVGLGRERMVVREERFLQFTEVLDDAVEDDRELVVDARGERMRVFVGDLAVRRPARVPNARRRVGSVEARFGLELVEVADRAHVVETLLLEQREAGGVITAVLEPLEAVKK
jgi:hypothetical protein